MSTPNHLDDADVKEAVGRWLRVALTNEPLILEEGRSVDDYVSKLLSLADFGFVVADSALAGMVAFYRNDPSRELCFISALAVSRKFRQMGIAGALLQYVHARALEYGARTCQLRVHRDNHSAQQLYARAGYAIANVDAHHLVMRKQLDAHVPPHSNLFNGHSVIGCSELAAHGGLAFSDPYEATE